MRIDSCHTTGLMMVLAMMAATSWAQDKPACDSNGNIKTPELVEGKVSKMDRSQGKVTVRDGDGKDYEFLASSETLQDIMVGDVIKAKLRQAPKCAEK